MRIFLHILRRKLRSFPLPGLTLKLPPQEAHLGTKAVGPMLVSPFGTRGGSLMLNLELKSLRLLPLPPQNLNTPRRVESGSRGFWGFRPGCGRYYHQWAHEGLIVPGPYELSGHSLDICCHQFVDLQGIFTPCGSSGFSHDCDWRSFGCPESSGSQLVRLSPDGMASCAQSRSVSSTLFLV